MLYKASDVETSTRDWFALSFNTIPWALLALASAEGEITEDTGEEPEEPEEPCDDDYPNDPDGFTRAMSEYETAFEAWKEAHDAWEEKCDNAGSEPMWPYVWEGDGCCACTSEALAVGLRVMEHPVLGTFFAADSAGHSFFGAYWIPLRARVASRQIESNDALENVKLVVMLAREYRAEGEGGKDPVGAICELLGIQAASATPDLARAAYAETSR